MNTAAELYFLYKIIKGLTTPFNQTQAYKLGIIDANGRLLKNSSQFRTKAESDAFTLFDRFIFNLKRLLAKIPGGSSKLASYLAVAYLLKENFDDEEENTSKNIGTSVDAIFESIVYDDSTLEKGNYELLETAFDTDGNTVLPGETLVLLERSHPFLNICGTQVYQLLSAKTGNLVITTKNALLEDGGIPANNVGSAHIAGLGVGDKKFAEPGIPVKKKRKTDIFKRKPPVL